MIWAQLNREGIRVARCTVERLMRTLGLSGAVRGRIKRTTVAADPTARPADLVDRVFTVAAPNRLWVAHLTYVRTWSGFVCVSFITDASSRRIVGWNASRSLRTDPALYALEQAICERNRQGVDLEGLIHHFDRVCSTCRSATPNGSPKTTSWPRWDPAAARSTMRRRLCRVHPLLESPTSPRSARRGNPYERHQGQPPRRAPLGRCATQQNAGHRRMGTWSCHTGTLTVSRRPAVRAPRAVLPPSA